MIRFALVVMEVLGIVLIKDDLIVVIVGLIFAGLKIVCQSPAIDGHIAVIRR